MATHDSADHYGRVTAPGAIEFRRVLPGPIERVWSYLTDSEKRGEWFAAGAMEPKPGGQFELIFDHGSLSDEKQTPEKWKSSEGFRWSGKLNLFEPPRLLSWIDDDGSEVIFELSEQGKDVLLVLTHRHIPQSGSMKEYAGGWHSHLNVLVDRMNNREPKGFWTKHLRHDEEYAVRLKDAPAYAPSAAPGSPVYARVTQKFSAVPERVFDAWLDPAMLGKFMFGPQLRNEEIVRLTLDPKVGGTFSFVVRRQGQEIDHIGRYEVIDRPRRLVFTWAVAPDRIDASRVEISIAPEGAGCTLTLSHELAPEWAEYKDRTQQGWTTMVGALKNTLG